MQPEFWQQPRVPASRRRSTANCCNHRTSNAFSISPSVSASVLSRLTSRRTTCRSARQGPGVPSFACPLGFGQHQGHGRGQVHHQADAPTFRPRRCEGSRTAAFRRRKPVEQASLPVPWQTECLPLWQSVQFDARGRLARHHRPCAGSSLTIRCRLPARFHRDRPRPGERGWPAGQIVQQQFGGGLVEARRRDVAAFLNF